MLRVRAHDFLLMRLLINTRWSREGEKLRLGIDVRGLARFFCGAVVQRLMCELAVDVILF